MRSILPYNNNRIAVNLTSIIIGFLQKRKLSVLSHNMEYRNMFSATHLSITNQINMTKRFTSNTVQASKELAKITATESRFIRYGSDRTYLAASRYAPRSARSLLSPPENTSAASNLHRHNNPMSSSGNNNLFSSFRSLEERAGQNPKGPFIRHWDSTVRTPGTSTSATPNISQPASLNNISSNNSKNDFNTITVTATENALIVYGNQGVRTIKEGIHNGCKSLREILDETTKNDGVMEYSRKYLDEKKVVHVTPNGEAFQKTPVPTVSFDNRNNQVNNTDVYYSNQKGEQRPLLSKKNVCHPLKDQNGTTYKTDITSETKASDLSNEIVVQEMGRRLLVKKDDKTDTNFITESGDNIISGECSNNSKVTPLGIAYADTVYKPIPNINDIPPLIKNFDELKMISTNIDKEFCLVETGKQRHVYPAILHEGFFYTPGYLTGAKGAHFLSKKKFDTFQKEKEHNISQEDIETKHNPSAKCQSIVEFKNLLRIAEDQANLLKGGKEYFIDINCLEYLISRFKLLKNKPFINYDPRGITKQHATEMIKEHDRRVINDICHPKTHKIQKKASTKDTFSQEKNTDDEENT